MQIQSLAGKIMETRILEMRIEEVKILAALIEKCGMAKLFFELCRASSTFWGSMTPPLSYVPFFPHNAPLYQELMHSLFMDEPESEYVNLISCCQIDTSP